MLLRAGYRYLHSFSGDPAEHRTVLEATARYPLAAGVLVSLRNRVDLRFIGGDDSWRFRSRLSAEKELSIGRVRMNPYVRGELYLRQSGLSVEPGGVDRGISLSCQPAGRARRILRLPE